MRKRRAVKIATEEIPMAKVRQPNIAWAREWLKTTKSLYIDGEWVEGRGPVLESVNPATGEVIGHIRCADQEDIDRAAQAARRAFDNGSWTRDINHRDRRHPDGPHRGDRHHRDHGQRQTVQ